MSEKSEALRLADALSAAIKQVDADDDVIHVARWFVEDADAELRRLVAEHEEDQRVIAVWRGRTQRAEAQRDALLEAFKSVLCRFDPQAVPGYEINIAAVKQAEATIKAVEEGK